MQFLSTGSSVFVVVVARKVHFPLVLQQNRQCRSNSFFCLFWSILDHFRTSEAIFGPDFLQKPSLRVWPAQPKVNFLNIGLPSSGPDLDN